LFAVAVALSLFATARATQVECFTIVDEYIMPLRAETMPASFASKLYLPEDVFLRAGLTAVYNPNNDTIAFSMGRKHLYFYVRAGGAFDESGNVYEFNVERISGIYFFPATFTSEYFGFRCAAIPATPMHIVRIVTPNAKFTDAAYVSYHSAELLARYTEYKTPKTSPTVTPTPPVNSPTVETPTPPPTYENVTLWFSLHSPSPDSARLAMGALELYGARGCFWFTADEVRAYPALVREVAGRGHSVGIWLESGAYDEYADASALLFEAARIKTPLVASPADVTDTVAAMCAEYGLVYRSARDADFDGAVTLPTTASARVELRGSCEHIGGLSAILAETVAGRYNVGQLRETTELQTEG
jgi:hypothetical protein